MKKSYRLLGALWDQIPEIKFFPSIIKKNLLHVNNYDISYNLFDSELYERKISLRKLLQCENKNSLDAIMKMLKPCKKIYLVLDYEPTYKTAIINQFLHKRILQIYTLLAQTLAPTKIIVVKNS